MGSGQFWTACNWVQSDLKAAVVFSSVDLEIWLRSDAQAPAG